MRFALIMLCLAVLVSVTTAFAAAKPPELTAQRAARPPSVDGRVTDDPAWAAVQPQEGFTLLGKSDLAKGQTEVRVLYDDRKLYVSYVCAIAAGATVQAGARPRDGQVYMDECVELFLAPDATQPQQYLHFIVNAAGSMQDELVQDWEWNTTWQAGAVQRGGGWEAELAIPWSGLPLTPATGSTWRVNFCRHSPGGSETSSWAPCKSSFHEPESFGRLEGLQVDFSPVVRAGLLSRVSEMETQAQALASLREEGTLAARARLIGRRLERAIAQLRERLPGADAAALRQIEADRQALDSDLAKGQRLASRVALAEQARQITGDEGWAVCVESPMRKIPAYEAYAGEAAREARVELARNEYEGTQIVAVSLGDRLEDVQIEVRDLRGPGSAVLGKDQLRLRRIAYVNVQQSSGRAPLKPGLLPDPLVDYEPQQVAESGFLPLLLTVHAPADQTPGSYEGQLVVQPKGRKPWPLKLSVRVWDFALPRASLLRNCFNLNAGYLPRYHDVWDGKNPPGWTLGRWVGADMSGIPDYFGWADFDNGVTEENPHSGKRCAWISCANWRKGSKEAPRAAYMFALDLGPGAYTLRFAYRTDSDETPVNYSISDVCWEGLEASTAWREVSRTFEVTEPRKVWVYLRLEGPGKVWFDSTSLTDAEGKELVPNPGFEHIGSSTLDKLLIAYRENMLAHRASDMNVAAPRIMVDGDKVNIDWSDFDREIEHYLALGLNAFNVYWARIQGGWGKVADLDENAPDARLSAEILRQTEAHLAEKGWLDLAYLYVIDEPGAKYFDQVKQIFGFVHRVAPRLKRLLTYGYGASRPIEPGKPVYAELAGYVDIHVPHTDCVEPIYLDQRRKAGEEIWAYVCISAQSPYLNIWGVDYPGTDPRVLFWQFHRERITGFLYWAITYWEKNPWEDPLTYPGGNSDGSMLYPGESGPVDSLRWETTRDGIEDYDYLALASQWAEKLRAAGNTALAAQLDAVCDVEDVTRSWTEYTRDPAVVLAHRRKLGEALSKAALALGETGP